MKSLKYQIGGLNKNLINGSSHAHVMDDQQGSERFFDVEYHKYIFTAHIINHTHVKYI